MMCVQVLDYVSDDMYVIYDDDDVYPASQPWTATTYVQLLDCVGACV
jgi:hypothetical protein